MAQITKKTKKFQPGGTLTYNGKQYTAEQVNEFLSAGGFESSERAALAGVISAIQNGKNRYFDANANSLSGDGNANEDFVDYFGSERRANRGASGWKQGKSRRHAQRNSDFHIRDKALSKLGGIEAFFDAKNKSGEEEANDKIKLDRDSERFFLYDASGKYITGPDNSALEKYIRDHFKYLAANEEERKKYDITAWGDDTLGGLTTWYQPGYDVENLLKAAQSGVDNLTPEQLNILKALNIVQDSETLESQKAKASAAAVRQRWENANLNYEDWGGIADLDENGQLVLRRDEVGKSFLSDLYGDGNFYFNDDFVKQHRNFKFLKDYFLIDGKFYKASDADNTNSELYRILREADGFYDLNSQHRWADSNKLIRHIWDTNGEYAKDYRVGVDPGTASEFLTVDGRRWTNFTGAYNHPDLKPGEQLIAYYDKDGQYNSLGFGTKKWAIIDNRGRLLRHIQDPTQLTLTGQNAAQELNLAAENVNTGDEELEGMRPVGYAGRAYSFEYDPVTKAVLYSGPIRGAQWDENNQKFRIPEAISKILFKPGELESGQIPKFFKMLDANPTLMRRWQRTLGGMINSGVRDLVTGDGFDNIKDFNSFIENGILTSEEAAQLLKLFLAYQDNDGKIETGEGSKSPGRRDSRRYARILSHSGDQIVSEKCGGLIPKHQPGGVVGSTKTRGINFNNQTQEVQNPNNFATLGKDKLTTADWIELGGAAADLGALTAGLAGGVGVAGALGLAGTTAGLIADVTRDGLDLGDIGNAALGYGLDTVSFFLPQSQLLKSSKIISKTAPLLMKAFSLAGMTSAIAATKRLVNGEGNARDVRTIVNGLSGAIMMHKQGVFNSGTKKGTVDVPETGKLKYKVEGSDKIEELPLDTDDIKALKESANKGESAKLKDFITQRQGIDASKIDLEPSKQGRGITNIKNKEKYSLGIEKAHTTTGEDAPVKTLHRKDVHNLSDWMNYQRARRTQYNDMLRGKGYQEVVEETIKTVDVAKTAQELGISESEVKRLMKEIDGEWRVPITTKKATTELDYEAMAEQLGSTPEEVKAVFKDITESGAITKTVEVDEVVDQAAFLKDAKKLAKKDRTEDMKRALELSSRFKKMTAEQRKLARRAAIFTPNATFYTDDVIENPSWAVAAPITYYPRERRYYKKGGILKGAEGLAEIMALEGLEFRDKINELGVDWLKSLSEEEKGQIKTKLESSAELALARDKKKAQELGGGYTPTFQISSSSEITAPDLSVVSTSVSEEPIAESISEYLRSLGQNRNARRADRIRSKAREAALKHTAGNNTEEEPIVHHNASSIFRASKLLNAIMGDKKQREYAYKNYLAAMRNMENNVPEYYDRFQDFDIKQQYNLAANQMRRPTITAHSDINSLLADKRSRTDKATLLELEGGLKHAQAYSDWLGAQNGLRRDYAQLRTNVENRNRSKASNAEAEYLTNMGASTAQMQNVYDNMLNEQLSLYNQDRSTMYQIAQQGIQSEYNTNRADLQRRLKSEIPEGQSESQYFAENPDRLSYFQNENKNITDDYIKKGQKAYLIYNLQSPWTRFIKKGGKIGSKNVRRSASEQIWIDNNKEAQKTLRQLSKQAIEFLKKALK